MTNIEIINADAMTALKGMPEASFSCCVTSHPYWGLRDYGGAVDVAQDTLTRAQAILSEGQK